MTAHVQHVVLNVQILPKLQITIQFLIFCLRSFQRLQKRERPGTRLEITAEPLEETQSAFTAVLIYYQGNFHGMVLSGLQSELHKIKIFRKVHLQPKSHISGSHRFLSFSSNELRISIITDRKKETCFYKIFTQNK